MTSITVAGSLFFLLAAPEKVSPHCYARETVILRGLCTVSTIAFWTYPVVCCLFVVLVYAKNLVDQRTYYEFLLHKVIIGYGRVPPYKQPVVLVLLAYALLAFSALVWYHLSQSSVVISHVYCSLAYITPIISFLAVLATQWSIQGKLITLPNFLADYDWAMQHLNRCRCYKVEELHAGYIRMEQELDQTEETLETPLAVALVEHYTKEVKANRAIQDKKSEAAGTPSAEVKEDADKEKSPTTATAQEVQENMEAGLTEGAEEVALAVEDSQKWIYWEVRLLFNPRLQDERSQSFRNWALAFMVSVVFAILLSVYVFICCLVTCLEIEHVLHQAHPAWGYTHPFSLRPDLGAGGRMSLKKMAASVAMSAMQTGARSFSKNHQGGLSQFQIGAAA